MTRIYAVTLTVLLAVCASAVGARAEFTTQAYVGWDAPGNDVESFLSGDQANCAQICLERDYCLGAVFNVVTGRCWVKHSTPAFSQAADGVLLLKMLAGRDGIDYPGGDYRWYQTAHWQYCSRTCFLESQCVAFTYNKVTQTCWLKNAIVDAAFHPDGIAGRK